MAKVMGMMRLTSVLTVVTFGIVWFADEVLCSTMLMNWAEVTCMLSAATGCVCSIVWTIGTKIIASKARKRNRARFEQKMNMVA